MKLCKQTNEHYQTKMEFLQYFYQNNNVYNVMVNRNS